ncbi:Gamma-tubulin complex component 2 isoform A [Glycine soja]|uniref:Gamma-tubulin complex component n=1 Tax=Glycine soja TaxID=3848 RepID=A0A445F0V0_GLYSO|nr:Gamma-tubulin complex component 2 isoform A [Glycine soja]
MYQSESSCHELASLPTPVHENVGTLAYFSLHPGGDAAALALLTLWVYEGVIDDPYGEFFIAEDKSLQKESLTQDYEAKYWQQRYSLKDGIPSFLANIAGAILTTRKYLNVMRECGHTVRAPPSENSKLMSFGSNHHYLECIKAAYNFASSELLNLIKEKYDLTGRLRSIKHYLLLDQGDFLVHFMDIARDELAKKPDEVSVEKLQERSSLIRRLGTFNDLEVTQRNSGNNVLEEPVSITGLETFSLSYKVHWPLSIVLSRKALTKYQLLFRFLFHCKHVDRQLCGAWQVHQGVRALNTRETAISRSSLLCRSMLKFINSLLHYLTFEASLIFLSTFMLLFWASFNLTETFLFPLYVIEPNWHLMYNRLQSANSIDEGCEVWWNVRIQLAKYGIIEFWCGVCKALSSPTTVANFAGWGGGCSIKSDIFCLKQVIQQHDFFLDKCLRECLLLLPELLKKVERLKSMCLQYAAATQWLISSSIELHNPEEPIDESIGLNKAKGKSGQVLKSTTRNVAVTDSVLKFEKEFNTELQSLGSILSSNSQAEPYLSHLAQWLLGVKNEKNGL